MYGLESYLFAQVLARCGSWQEVVVWSRPAPRGTCADWDFAFAIVVARKVNRLSWIGQSKITRSSWVEIQELSGQ